MNDTSLSPYWAIVNLTAFATGDSKVLFQNYHIDTNPNPTVFEKVNMYVSDFIQPSDFNATWITVVTYKNIRPEDTRDNNLVRNMFCMYVFTHLTACTISVNVHSQKRVSVDMKTGC